MAAAVSGCNGFFSVISPTFRFRYSVSSKSCLASSRRSTSHVTQRAIHHKRRTTGPNRGPTSSKRKNRQKEAAIQNNYSGRSKDESPCAYADGSTGSQFSTVYGSFGVQRDDKDFSIDLKEHQVKPSINRESDFLNAIVKVYCTHKEPDYSLPWQKKRQYTSTGSAFMIEGGKLLTNSHCVEYHTQVQVKRRGDDTKYVAKVLARGVDCDLALLSVENEEFWRDVEPLRFGETPHLQDAVTVVGYPLGGETISVTKGVVSRIEVTLYSHGSSDLLGIQIDAAINPGNSGGPVFNDNGECIGVAFQVHGSEEAENIGYVIPTVVVSHFLTDYKKNGRYTGFPTLGVLVQNLDNPTIRACFRVRSNEGVLVRSVDPTSDANNVLKEGDVIVSFDDVRVSCEGTIPFRYDEDVGFHYLITEKFAGDTAEVCFLRAGRFMKEKVILNPRVHLVPFHLDGRQPSYLIIGGLVFTPLSEPLIEEEDEDSIGLTLLTKARYSLPRFRGEQIVILSQVLAHEVNIGYEDMSNEQVVKFNGTLIKNIHHLAHLIDTCKDKYLIFEFDSTYTVVLEREAAAAAASCILRDYGIPSERSYGLSEPYVDPLVDNQAALHEFGDTPASNCEIDYDGLRWV